MGVAKNENKPSVITGDKAHHLEGDNGRKQEVRQNKNLPKNKPRSLSRITAIRNDVAI